MLRRLRSKIRRTTFALHRSIWDTRDAVGDHTLFAALVAVTVVVLTLVFIGRDDLLAALYGLAAVWLVFLVFVVFKFAQAFARPQKHPDLEWGDYGVQEDRLRLGVRSLEPLRPRSGPDPGPLICRIMAPDGSVWISRTREDQSWIGIGELRSYPPDFKCSKCGLSPSRLLVGTYEVTWLKPSRGLFKRPLLHYTLQVPEHEKSLSETSQHREPA